MPPGCGKLPCDTDQDPAVREPRQLLALGMQPGSRPPSATPPIPLLPPLLLGEGTESPTFRAGADFREGSMF